jgi:hypothetical protein
LASDATREEKNRWLLHSPNSGCATKKIERDNIDDKQLATLQETAALWLAADNARLERALADGNLIEVRNDD